MLYDPFIWLHNSQLSLISSFFKQFCAIFAKFGIFEGFSCLLSVMFMIYRGILYLVKGGQPCFMIHPFAFMAGWLKLRFNKRDINRAKKSQITLNNCHYAKRKFKKKHPTYNLASFGNVNSLEWRRQTSAIYATEGWRLRNIKHIPVLIFCKILYWCDASIFLSLIHIWRCRRRG